MTEERSTTGDRRVRIAVHYPVQRGRMVLRSEADWDADIEAVGSSPDGTRAEFLLPVDGPFTYFKPVIVDGTALSWSRGDNFLVLAGSGDTQEIYPYFMDDAACSVCELKTLPASKGPETHSYRIFYPPGYHENTLKRYPVLYMHDGQNLFFPDEAFQGHDWKIRETLAILDSMSAIDEVIVVGIYPNERVRDYTRPGYEAYGEFIVRSLKPAVDAEYRTLTGPSTTAVMGSSLGGVVSFYLAWHWPEVFGMAACMSSTFGWQDDLRRRVAEEKKRNVRFYLDSGWPRDNYEVTRDMRSLLIRRGFQEGRDLNYFAFPGALHNESSWAMRAHLPFQLFFGRSGPAA